MSTWNPTSWENCYYPQKITYPDPLLFQSTLHELSRKDGLTKKNEILQLKKYLNEVALQKSFILHAGDCAELFKNCNQQYVHAFLDLMFDLAFFLEANIGKRVHLITRLAGQYAKPRTKFIQERNGNRCITYRGDLINSANFSNLDRLPDPHRMLEGWMLAMKTKEYCQSYPNKREVFFSKEALLLEYEQQFTQQIDGEWYNLSTHLPWIGKRTLLLDSAHIEYVRGLTNPVAVKIGPDITAESLLRIIDILNPTDESGKLILIHRIGVDCIAKSLPKLLQNVVRHFDNVIWVCDPMHGNTNVFKGKKYRAVFDIVRELKIALDIHQAFQSFLGGVHLEITAEHIRECVTKLPITEITTESILDPRLNGEQAHEILSVF